MKRREFIAAVGGAGLTLAGKASAQTPEKTWRLCALTGNQALGPGSPLGKVLLEELGRQGYAIGRNLIFDSRGAGGELARIPQLIEGFKVSGVDALLVVGYPTALAAKAAGIPTVIAYGTGDPVATGLVDSLARPGGVVTGISDDATMLSTKRMSLLKGLSPKLHRIAMLWNSDDLGMTLRYQASVKAAQALDLNVQPLGVREPDDFNGVFEAMDREPPDAILMVTDALTALNRNRVFEYAAAKHLPAIYEYDSFARDGGLMSYGPDLKESIGRAAALVARIFKGTKPSDLPFEEPTRYLFVVNLKTAKATGIDVPPNLVALADEVIE